MTAAKFTPLKWFREWRAWVRAKKDEREHQLERLVKDMALSLKYPEACVSAADIIELVRRHDRRGIA